VTDVAARGIDVPLIDHVVHYAFPPSAKLFIHRSGRAARAGRIGYAWGIVEPEEVAYMVDLHAFLGRKLSTGIEANDTTEPTGDDYTYTLEEMTPEMVHYGSIPETVVTEEVENVRRIMNSELTSSIDAQDIRSLVKVCDNAMKQYRRSRPEASGAGARRGRAILEGTKNVTGERQTVSIPCHPLLRGVEIGRVKSHFTDANKGDAKNVKSRLDEMKKREEFLQAMAAFRPKETIFEAFSTGGGKEVNVVSQVDKGRTVSGAKGSQTSSAGLKAMKNMRRQMKMARDKGSALIVAGSKNALVMNGDAVEVDDEVEHIVEEGKTNRTLPEPKKEEIVPSKRRLSKAERKRLKSSDGKSTADMSSDLNEAKPIKGKEKRGADFRDMAFFISDENMVEEVNQEAVTRSREIEAAMQPSSALGSKSMADRALRLESSMMDIVGDESSDMIQKQRMMRWDKSKRKYIQSTLGQELAGDSKTKRIRLESGKLIKNDKAKLGELYEKWQKKTNRSIGRTGVFDDVTTDVSTDVDISDGRAGGRGGKRTWIKNAILNSKTSKEKSEVVDVRDAGDKPMSAKQIRQERESKQNMKMKNMKKGDRKQVEKKLRGKRVAEVEEKIHKKSAYNKKKGASGQWKKGGKR
jgi:ATP-dependent RNA helicase DDX54/DBP10